MPQRLCGHTTSFVCRFVKKPPHDYGKGVRLRGSRLDFHTSLQRFLTLDMGCPRYVKVDSGLRVQHCVFVNILATLVCARCSSGFSCDESSRVTSVYFAPCLCARAILSKLSHLTTKLLLSTARDPEPRISSVLKNYQGCRSS